MYVGVGACGAYQLSFADFNLDGKLDLAVSNTGNATVSILLGVGDGTFMVQTGVAFGNAPTHVSVGDFNKDGLPDIVAADTAAGAVNVRLNQCN